MKDKGSSWTALRVVATIGSALAAGIAVLSGIAGLTVDLPEAWPAWTTRKAFLAGALAMALAAVLAAQETELLAEPNRVEATLALSGRVVDDEGRGLPRAEIRALPSMTATLTANPDLDLPDGGLSSVTTHADAEGRFELRGLVAGVAYSLWTSLSGYASTSLVTPTLKLGEPPAALRITLEPDRGVIGRVLDPDHDPIAGATAELRNSRGVFRGAKTDATGHFVITDVGSGKFTFAVWTEGYATRLVSGLRIDLSEGTADLGAIHLDGGVTVVGMVTDSRGRPLDGAAVWSSAPRLQDRHAGAIHRMTTGADGVFAIPNLPRGALVQVDVFRDGYQNRTERLAVCCAEEIQDLPWQRTASTEGLDQKVELQARVSGAQVATETLLAVVMAPGFSLLGHVVDAQGQPVDRAEIELRWPDGSHRFTFSVPDGSFDLYRLPPGRATLCVTAGEGFLGPLAVEIGAELDQEMELVLRPGATIDGHLKDPDGKSIEEAKITLDRYPPVSLGADTFFGYLRSTYITISQDSGRFAFSSLAAGAYRLRFEHPDLEPFVELVEIDDGVPRRLDVAFGERRGKIPVRGDVVDDLGHSVAGAVVRLTRGEQLLDEAESFSDGSFHLRAPRPSVYTVTASHEQHAEGRVNQLDVPPGGRDSVVLPLVSGAVVRGEVRGHEPVEVYWLRVSARSPEHGERASVVIGHNQYRITGLEPGSWTIEATLQGTGRTASGQVTVGAAGAEAILDLELTEPTTRVPVLRR